MNKMYLTLKVSLKVLLLHSLLLFTFYDVSAQDTDGDGIANATDLDDDNDGISDAQEAVFLLSGYRPLCGAAVKPDFSSPATLISGTDKQVGSRYRIANVLPNTDAIVEIEKLQNITDLAIDDNSLGHPAAFQPVTTSTGQLSTNQEAYTQYKITFVNAGSTTDTVVIGAMYANISDIDGNATNSGEIVYVARHSGYTLNNQTALSVTNSSYSDQINWTKVVAGTTEADGVDTLNKNIAFTVRLANFSSFRIRLGVVARENVWGLYYRPHRIDFTCPLNYANPNTYIIDFDEDGIPNELDPDSDNDGIADVKEAGGEDPDNNGIVGTGQGITDPNSNGLAAAVDPDEGGIALVLIDTDGDLNPDFFDIDSDNDGITDLVEGQPTFTFKAIANRDDDSDGIDNAFDNLAGFGTSDFVSPVNNDTDDIPDYLDPDSDNDNQADALEGWDHDNNDVADIVPSGIDGDEDGLDDAYDVQPLSANPGNGQTPDSFPNSAASAEKDWREPYIASPIAYPDFLNGTEDNSISLNTLLTNDITSDDGPSLTNPFSVTVQPLNGVINHNDSGTPADFTDDEYTYVPDLNFNGTDTFVYQICDVNDDCDTALVTVIVEPVNDKPVLDNELLVLNEDSQITGDVTDTGDFDIDGTDLVVTLSPLSGPRYGNLTVNALGEFTYTPDLNYNGADTVVLEVCDGGVPLPASCSQDTLFITVQPVNDPPVVDNEFVVTDEDTGVSGALIDEGDADIDGTVLTASVTPLVAPKHGTIIISVNGAFTYQPSLNFFGNDTVVAEVCDSGLPAPGICVPDTIFITVNSVNDAPVANNDATMTNPSAPVSILVGSNDTDVDPETIFTYSVESYPEGTTAVMDPQTGELTYTPTSSGTPRQDIVTYKICDNGIPQLCDQAEVSVTVPALPVPPIPGNDQAATEEDTQVTVNVAANDLDPNGNLDPVSVSVFSGPLHGTASVNPATGELTYIPSPNFNGKDSLVYTICDDSDLCANGTLVLTVTAVNDSPVANEDLAAADPGIQISFNVGENDTDVDVGTVFAFTLLYNQAGTVAAIDPQTGVMTYTSGPSGTPRQDTVRYRVCDNGIPQLCSETMVLITIPNLPLPPIAKNDSLQIDEDTQGTIKVISNDRDVNGNLDSASVRIVAAPLQGNATVNAATGVITYIPDPDFNGKDTLTYTICDFTPECSEAKVFLVVNSINDKPVAMDDSTAANPAEPVIFNVGLNDSDVDAGSILTYTLIEFPAEASANLDPSTGVLNYTPSDSEIIRTDTVSYFICDNGTPTLCDTAQVLITVPIPDTPPVANDDAEIIEEDNAGEFLVLENDKDVNHDLDPGSLIILTEPQNGTASVASGKVSYMPVADYFGKDSLEYRICDLNSNCDTAWLRIEINPVNDKPLIENESHVIDEDTEVSGSLITAADTDPEGTALSPGRIITQPAHGTFTIQPSGLYTYIPMLNYNGTDLIVVEVCDSGIPLPGVCTNDTVFITVLPVNDSPVVGNVLANADPGVPTPINLSLHVSDPDAGTVFTYTILSNPQGTVADVNSASGMLMYTSLPDNTTRVDQVDYKVCDNGQPQLCASGSVLIAVPDRNFRARNDSVYILEEEVATVFVLDNDTNFHAVDTSSLVIINQPLHGQAVVDYETGTIVYTPTFDFYGKDTLRYRICKSVPPLLCQEAYVIFEVQPINDLYVTNDHIPATVGGTAVTGNFISNNIDPEGTAISSAELIKGAVYGTFSFEKDGTFNYQPFESAPSLTDMVIVSVCDEGYPTPGVCLNDTLYFELTQDLFISEGFTPNGDGQNDYFIIETAIPGNIDVKIYNRWGNLVYSNSNYQNNWNGAANEGISIGDTVPEGTYYYEITFGNGEVRRSYITILK